MRTKRKVYAKNLCSHAEPSMQVTQFIRVKWGYWTGLSCTHIEYTKIGWNKIVKTHRLDPLTGGMIWHGKYFPHTPVKSPWDLLYMVCLLPMIKLQPFNEGQHIPICKGGGQAYHPNLNITHPWITIKRQAQRLINTHAITNLLVKGGHLWNRGSKAEDNFPSHVYSQVKIYLLIVNHFPIL